jgi:hypothetical protein
MRKRILTSIALAIAGGACSKTESAKPSTAVTAPSGAITRLSVSASAVVRPTPEAAVPVLTVLATGQSRPVALTVRAGNVYWINLGAGRAGKPAPDAGSVMRVSRDGGAPVVLASKQDMPTAVAVDDSSAYWTTTDSVRRVNSSGGGVTTLHTMPAMSGIPTRIVLHDDAVFFGVLHASRGGLFRVPKAGGSGGPVAGGDEEDGFMIDDIAFLHDRIVTCLAMGNVMASVTLKTWYQKILFKDLKKCQHIAVDDDDVYWTETSGDTIQRLPWMMIPNPYPTKVASARSPTELVVNGGEVFWIEKAGRILRAPAHGGSSSVVADKLNAPQGLAVDDMYVYFASPEEGTVSRVARSPEAGSRSAPVAPAPAASAGAAVDLSAPARHLALAPADDGFVDSRGGWGWGDRCYTHLNAGELDWAEAACARAFDMKPASPQPLASLLYNEGQVEEKRKHLDAARALYQASIDLRPNGEVQSALKRVSGGPPPIGASATSVPYPDARMPKGAIAPSPTSDCGGAIDIDPDTVRERTWALGEAAKSGRFDAVLYFNTRTAAVDCKGSSDFEVRTYSARRWTSP